MTSPSALIEEAMRALANNDYVRAARILHFAAHSGDSHAQYLLAHAVRGMASDDGASPAMRRWYEAAAAQGHAMAAFELACLLDSRAIVRNDRKEFCNRNVERAESLYRQAMQRFKENAQRGESESQCMLGIGYRCGLGVPLDLDQSIFWLSEAYRNGCTDAANQLCSIYMSKQCPTELDRMQARHWYQEAKNAGCQCLYVEEYE